MKPGNKDLTLGFEVKSCRECEKKQHWHENGNMVRDGNRFRRTARWNCSRSWTGSAL